MTRGSEKQTAVSNHFNRCSRCWDADIENLRIQQPEDLRLTVPQDAIAKLCPLGRMLYEAYLNWLAEPDDGMP